MGQPVTAIRLRYVHRFTDRHGRVRHYLRRPGAKRVPLPGLPGSPEFMAAYQAAVAAPAQPQASASRPPAPGSLDALAAEFYASAAWKRLGPSTRRAYRRIVERLRAEHGPKPVRLLEPGHVEKLVAALADHPTAANHRLRLLRMMLKLAVKLGWRKDNPARDVERVPYRSPGLPSWSDEEIAAYEARWPLGTKQRLALALLLYTGQRRSDVVRMGRQHLRDGGHRIFVKQQRLAPSC